MRYTPIPPAFRKLTIGQLQKLFLPVGYDVNVTLRKQKQKRKARDAREEGALVKPQKKRKPGRPKKKAEGVAS